MKDVSVLNKKKYCSLFEFSRVQKGETGIGKSDFIIRCSSGVGWQEPEFQDEKLSMRPEGGRLLTCSSTYPAVKEETRDQGATGILVLRRNCSLDVKQLPEFTSREKKKKVVPGEGGKHLEVLSCSTP